MEALEDRTVPTADPLDPQLEHLPTPPQPPAAAPPSPDPSAPGVPTDAPELEGIPPADPTAAPGPDVLSPAASPADQGAPGDWYWAYVWVPVWEFDDGTGGVWVEEPPPAEAPVAPDAPALEDGVTVPTAAAAPPADGSTPPAAPPDGPQAEGAASGWWVRVREWLNNWLSSAAADVQAASPPPSDSGGEPLRLVTVSGQTVVVKPFNPSRRAGEPGIDLGAGSAGIWTLDPLDPPDTRRPGLQRLPGFGRDPVGASVRSLHELPYVLTGQTRLTPDQQATTDVLVARDTPRLNRELDSSGRALVQFVEVGGGFVSVGTEISVGFMTWPYGTPLIAHGMDRGVAKIETLRTGTPQMSLMAQGLHGLGLTKPTAVLFDDIGGDLASLGALSARGAILSWRASKAPPAPAGNTVGQVPPVGRHAMPGSTGANIPPRGADVTLVSGQRDLAISGWNLPGAQGMNVGAHRLTVAEMEALTETFGVEFALVYRRGPGPNGSGGHYILYSGGPRSVDIPLAADIIDIWHTHPRGVRFASEEDMKFLAALRGLQQQGGFPQQNSSRVIPVNNGPPVRYDPVNPVRPNLSGGSDVR